MNDIDWKKKLTKEQYAVLRNKATDAPFSGSQLHEDRDGVFMCAGCGSELFSSEHKFDSGSGWPSFYDADPTKIDFVDDSTHGMQRTEVICSSCGGHLGHLFDDAHDQPTGKRYCINSTSLDFKEK